MGPVHFTHGPSMFPIPSRCRVLPCHAAQNKQLSTPMCIFSGLGEAWKGRRTLPTLCGESTVSAPLPSPPARLDQSLGPTCCSLGSFFLGSSLGSSLGSFFLGSFTFPFFFLSLAFLRFAESDSDEGEEDEEDEEEDLRNEECVLVCVHQCQGGHGDDTEGEES